MRVATSQVTDHAEAGRVRHRQRTGELPTGAEIGGELLRRLIGQDTRDVGLADAGASTLP